MPAVKVVQRYQHCHCTSYWHS